MVTLDSMIEHIAFQIEGVNAEITLTGELDQYLAGYSDGLEAAFYQLVAVKINRSQPMEEEQ